MEWWRKLRAICEKQMGWTKKKDRKTEKQCHTEWSGDLILEFSIQTQYSRSLHDSRKTWSKNHLPKDCIQLMSMPTPAAVGPRSIACFHLRMFQQSSMKPTMSAISLSYAFRIFPAFYPPFQSRCFWSAESQWASTMHDYMPICADESYDLPRPQRVEIIISGLYNLIPQNYSGLIRDKTSIFSHLPRMGNAKQWLSQGRSTELRTSQRDSSEEK